MTITKPDLKTITEIVTRIPSALQFQHSLDYIQSSTNIGLERMRGAIVHVLVDAFEEGIRYAENELSKPKTETKGGSVEAKQADQTGKTATIQAKN